MAEQTPHLDPILSDSGSLAAAYFDLLYAKNPDPWGFASSPYEAAKYAVTLAALPRTAYQNALELGCSIGVLTEQLARRCDRLLALDVSEPALAQARARCATLPQVTFALCNAPTQFPAGSFDLILVSEVGYYLSQCDLECLREKIAQALTPHGHLLLVHWTGETNYPLTAAAVHETFLAWKNRAWSHLAAQEKTGYRLDLFERSFPLSQTSSSY